MSDTGNHILNAVNVMFINHISQRKRRKLKPSIMNSYLKTFELDDDEEEEEEEVPSSVIKKKKKKKRKSPSCKF